MLTIRPFCNKDLSRLLSLWKKSQFHGSRAGLIPLTQNTLQLQVLGIPFFDPRSVMLAFEDGMAVGYVHTTPGPTADGFDLNPRTGQICFLAVDPACSDATRVARALLEAAEHYLVGLGAVEIYGGSPRPCAPFYIGFHGGAEAIGFFDSETHLLRAFQETGYNVLKTTVRYRLNLANYTPPVPPYILQWMNKLDVVIDDFALPGTWWEACSFANYEWYDAVAKLKSNGRPVARVRVRIANPDTEGADDLYKDGWDAGLMDVRVHPDFHRRGVAAFTLREMLCYLVANKRVKQIEAHIADDSATMYPLLRSLEWTEVDTGKIFYKSVDRQ